MSAERKHCQSLRSQEYHCGLSPVATGGFGGISPPKRKYETLQTIGVLIKFSISSPPSEDFLAKVLCVPR